MTEIFRIPNFPDENLQYFTSLIENANSGQNQITVVGTDDIVNDNIGLLGPLGSLVGELCTVDSVTSSVITFISDLINTHRKTEPFTVLFGDQIRMYRATNTNNYVPPDTSFSLVSTTAIDYDQPFTLVADPSGGTQYWYKFTFFNSISMNETALAASIASRGGGLGHYVSVGDIRIEAGLMNDYQISDTQIATRRDQAESEIKGALLASDYVLPLTDNNNNLYVPPVIENIARMLAAGYVLTQDYGPAAQGDTKDGDEKIKQALGLLTEVQNHTIILADSNEAQMATNLRIKGQPTDQTQYTGNDTLAGNPPEPPIFTISKVW